MHNQTHNKSAFYTVDELAEFLKIGRSSAYELCKSNKFPTLRLGKIIRIPKQALYHWIVEQTGGDLDKTS
jgi:excisionase family DNA binding protein